MPISDGIVRDELPPARVGRTIGFLSALLALGGGIGIVIAGPLDRVLGYHWLFGALALVVAGAIAVTVLFVPESPVRAAGRLGVIPAPLLSAALVCILLGVSQTTVWGITSAPVLGLGAAGIAFAAGWVYAELHAAHPLIDVHMLARPAVWTTNAVSFLIGAAMYSVVAFLPQFLQAPSNSPATVSGGR